MFAKIKHPSLMFLLEYCPINTDAYKCNLIIPVFEHLCISNHAVERLNYNYGENRVCM